MIKDVIIHDIQLNGDLQMPKPPASHGAPWTRRDFATIRKLVREGTPTRKIAKVLGRSLGSLYVVASKEGISFGGPKRRARK